MNILKFLKNRNSTNQKDLDRNAKVLDGIVANIDSARGIARVMHTKAYNVWTKKAQKDLEQTFDTVVGKQRYALLSEEDRNAVILQVANKVERSPCAVVQRLRPTGRLKIRGNSQQTLKDIAEASKQGATA